MGRRKQPTFDQVRYLTDKGYSLTTAHQVLRSFTSAFGVRKADILLKGFVTRKWQGGDIASFCKNALWKKQENPEEVFVLEDELVKRGVDPILTQKVLGKYYGQFSLDVFLANVQLALENGCTLDEVFVFAHVIIDADADLLRERFVKARTLSLEAATVLRSFEEVDTAELKANVVKLKQEQEKCLEQVPIIEQKAAEQIANLLEKAMKHEKTVAEHRELISLLED